ncbi:MAG TPA: GlsB/YeaQ/YmgE family stress response membrane protein [Ferruginibacter sp.]|nr:GlsB/YeaQ/YmgE family stress response membrane protein [Ferruginibacter sp.]
METQSIIIILVLGALAGWIAGLVFQGGGLGLIGNIVVGILGGFIGYWLLPKLHVNIHTGQGWLDMVLTAAIGGVVLLMLINLLFGNKRGT